MKTVKRVSAINRPAYMKPTFGRSYSSFAPPAVGEWARASMHPNRLRFSIFSDENPAMSFIAKAAEGAREKRGDIAEDNIFLAAEKTWATAVGASLEAFGAARDAFAEQLFHLTYGTPFLQALVGVGDKETPGRRPERDLLREQARATKRAELETRFDKGAAIDAALRAIAYVRSAESGVQERAYAVVKQLHDAQPPGRPDDGRTEGNLARSGASAPARCRARRRRHSKAAAARSERPLADAEGHPAGRDSRKASCPPKPRSGSRASSGCSPKNQSNQPRNKPMPVLEAERTTTTSSAAKGHDKFEALLAKAQKLPPMATAVVHPCDEVSLESAVEAARLGLIEPILVGPDERIRAVAKADQDSTSRIRDRGLGAQPRFRGQGRRAGPRAAAPRR